MTNNVNTSVLQKLKKNAQGVFKVPHVGDIVEAFYVKGNPATVTFTTHNFTIVKAWEDSGLTLWNEKLSIFQNLPIVALPFENITIKLEEQFGNKAKVYAVYKHLPDATRDGLSSNPPKVCVENETYVYAINGILCPTDVAL